MNRKHFVLKCEDCGWHSDIDESWAANHCPSCLVQKYLVLLYGTKEELEFGNYTFITSNF